MESESKAKPYLSVFDLSRHVLLMLELAPCVSYGRRAAPHSQSSVTPMPDTIDSLSKPASNHVPFSSHARSL